MSEQRVTILNERHPVHELVQTELNRSCSTIHPNIARASVRYAITATGTGLDHAAGEQVMALSEEPHVLTLVTDRRVSGRYSRQFPTVRFHEIVALDVKAGLVKAIRVTCRDRFVDLHPHTFTQPVGTFLTRLCQLAPEHREPRVRPLCPATETDPTGAIQASQWLGLEAPKTTALLEYVHASHHRGMMPLAIAQDFVARIVLHHRNVHFGRGMAQGRWVSPVSANDLSNLMVDLYGNPLSVTETPVRTLELQPAMKADIGAAVSTAIGLTALALLGTGWVQGSAREPISRFQFMVADTASCASFRLNNGREPLEKQGPFLLHQTDVRLLALEEQVLVRRLARGWSEPTRDLLAVPDEAVLGVLSSVFASEAAAAS